MLAGASNRSFPEHQTFTATFLYFQNTGKQFLAIKIWSMVWNWLINKQKRKEQGYQPDPVLCLPNEAHSKRLIQDRIQ